MKRWNNHVASCIGTGRMGLALHKEYLEQLAKIQSEIGFTYIRGHGLFCDDMGIYQEHKEKDQRIVDYNFTYVDRVFDSYLELGLKPFVELGFMPEKLASGEHTVFYWKGNVTPPKEYERWTAMVQATLRHWIQRYGREEVLTWPIEVWNEPNLGSFWNEDGFADYLTLYEYSSKAVKAVDDELQVGGPAICGVNDEWWLREFLKACQSRELPIDFVTRHLYATEAPEWRAYYAYQDLRPLSVVDSELKVSREIIDSFECYRDMPMHITEFNTSYLPTCNIHDTNLNAAYVASMLAIMGDYCASYSYWTFGDVFEEAGIPKTLFHGGFGLLANGSIPKPTYWTFQFFSKLYKKNLLREESYVISQEGDNLRGVIYHPDCENKKTELTVTIPFDVVAGTYRLLVKRVGEESCNPRKTWYDLGTPRFPSKEEICEIKESANPLSETKRMEICGHEQQSLTFTLKSNEVLYFELKKIEPQEIPGFDLNRN